MKNYILSLFRRLSTLHPQIAMKKSSAFSSLRHRLSSCLPFLSIASSSLLISSISNSVNCSKRLSSSRTAWITLLFIFFSTKVMAFPDSTKHFMLFQEKPGLINISRNQLKEMASEKVLLVVPEDHIQTYPKEFQSSLSTLGRFINIVKTKQERMPRHFIINIKNEFNFNGAVGQFIEHADNIEVSNKDKEEK